MAQLVPSTEDRRIYEFCVLYPANLSQKEEQDFLKSFEGMIEEVGGKQVAKDMWGKRGLAFPVKGHTEGCFVIYHYDLEPEKIEELDEEMLIMQKLLRHMIVKPPKGYEVISYAEHYKKWLTERDTEEEAKTKRKEEKLQEKVVQRAKRQVKRVEEQKKEAKEPKASGKDIAEGLEKLISDDDLDI